MKKAEYKIFIRGNGREFLISPDSALRLLDGGLYGFDSIVFDVDTGSYANTDGGYIKRRRFAERELNFTFEITENDTRWRRQILSVVHPMADCEITATLRGVTRRITAVPMGKVAFLQENFHDKTVVKLQFLAPTPFLMAEEAKTGEFIGRIALLTFPMNFYPRGNLTAGYRVLANSSRAFNEGDVACGVVITIRASGGNVVNPRIRCGAHTIRTTVTLADGDEMVIDTRPRQKGIRINGENRPVFDWKSTFFSLDVGNNVLELDADSGKESMAAQYEYIPLYFGM